MRPTQPHKIDPLRPRHSLLPPHTPTPPPLLSALSLLQLWLSYDQRIVEVHNGGDGREEEGREGGWFGEGGVIGVNPGYVVPKKIGP